MILIIQESVKKRFACRSLDFVGIREDFSYICVINGHLGGHLVRILILLFIFWVRT